MFDRFARRQGLPSFAAITAAAFSLAACASHTPLLASDGVGNYVFGTVVRSYEPGGAGRARLAARARAFCGGEDAYALRLAYGPPGETPPLAFEAEPSRNNFRDDMAEYGIVACRNDPPGAEASSGVPRVRILHDYDAVDDDAPAVSPTEVRVVEDGGRGSFPPSAIESIETHLKPPFKAEQIKVTLTPDYPTKTDRDRLLGFFEVGVLEGDDAARAVGAQHGANLLVKEKSAGVYLAFHVSHAYPTVDEAIAALDLPNGWKSIASSKFGDPAQDGSIEIDAVVGKCYAIVGAFGPDATVEERAPRLTRSWEGALGLLHPAEFQSFGAFRGRSFLSAFGCPARPSKLGLKVSWRAAGGKGSYELRVYSRAATAVERSDVELYATQETCRECQTDRLACLRAAGLTEIACSTALRSTTPGNVGGLVLDGYH